MPSTFVSNYLSGDLVVRWSELDNNLLGESGTVSNSQSTIGNDNLNIVKRKNRFVVGTKFQ